MIDFRTLLLALAACLLCVAPVAADDRTELETLLRDFLAGASERAVHETFWAEDLIYTSSAGERFGKAEILAGFDDADDSNDPSSYGAEDVTVRLIDDLAVVTFRLTADRNGERAGEFYNTGVFRHEAGAWQAFTWQATRIPSSE